jgi:hypothetical protein
LPAESSAAVRDGASDAGSRISRFAVRGEKFGSSRRTFLTTSVAAALGLLVDEGSAGSHESAIYGQTAPPCPPDPIAGGVRLETLALDELEAGAVPMHRVVGAGLDARLFTDLSTIRPETLITPNDQFFVRTTCPPRAL